MSAPVTRRRPQGGPPPLAPALAYGALLIASVAIWIGGPQPGTSAASTLSYAQMASGTAASSRRPRGPCPAW